MIARLALALALALTTAAAVRAQDPPPAPADTLAPVDTTEPIEEIERRLIEQMGEDDTTAADAAPAPRQPRSLNPDISAIGDFLVDLSPEESTLEGGDRLQMREVEIAFQGAVDPYFRYDAFIGAHEDEIEIEEAYATTLGIPGGLQFKLGKFLLPFGKVNLTHRPELNTIDYPLYVQEYFGEEGFKSTGVWGSLIGAPLGFFQELSLVLANGAEAHAHGEEEETHALAPAQEEEDHDEGKDLFEDLADRLVVAHLKNSIDLSEASNLELGASFGTSNAPGEEAEGEEAEGRTNLYGLDAIWRWKPPQTAKYRSAILQAEVAWRETEESEAGLGNVKFGRWKVGYFLFGQWQLSRRTFVGARLDYAEPPIGEGPRSREAGQVLLRYFPTEFSQLRLAYERQDPDPGDAVDRLLFQATFAIGPHRPHAY